MEVTTRSALSLFVGCESSRNSYFRRVILRVGMLRLPRPLAGEIPGPLRMTVLSQQQVARNEEKEQHRNHAIHGEKCGIQPAEIFRRDQRMFVNQQ